MYTCHLQVPSRAGFGAGRAARGGARMELLTWSTPRGPGPRAGTTAARAIVFRGRAGPDSEHQSTMSRASNASPKSRKTAKILGKIARVLCNILYCYNN